MFLCSWFWRTVGVSLFLGVVLACPPCFLGFGVLLVSRFFLPSCGLVVGGGGRVVGGFLGFGVWVRPCSCSLWGWGSGAPGAPGSCVFVRGLGACARLVLASLCFGGWGLGVFVRLVHSWDAVSGGGSGGPALFGVGCAWFPGSCSRWFLVVFAEGFPGVFVSARRFLPLVWGVSGWVGVVFSPAVVLGPGLFRVRVLVLFGEFDPGSGRTLAACSYIVFFF